MSGQRHTAQIPRNAKRARERGGHIAHGGVVLRLRRCRARPNGISNAASALAAGHLPNQPAALTHHGLTPAGESNEALPTEGMFFPGVRRGVPVAQAGAVFFTFAAQPCRSSLDSGRRHDTVPTNRPARLSNVR
jgi:hypothetical protein